MQDMTSKPAGGFARGVGVLGGLTVVAIASVLTWVLGVAPLLVRRSERSFGDAMGFMVVLGVLPVLALLVGVGIHAIVDARRKATGSPALRLGIFFALLCGLSSAGLAESSDAIVLVLVLAVPTVLNLGAWWSFRRRRRAA